MTIRRHGEVPVIESLRVKNYRALKDLDLRPLTPLTVLVGPNGSGKSTVFDVFAFLSECFTVGLRKAWDKRGRFRELRSRDAVGSIVFALKYREPPIQGRPSPLITYPWPSTKTPAGRSWPRNGCAGTAKESGGRSGS